MTQRKKYHNFLCCKLERYVSIYKVKGSFQRKEDDQLLKFL